MKAKLLSVAMGSLLAFNAYGGTDALAQNIENSEQPQVEEQQLNEAKDKFFNKMHKQHGERMNAEDREQHKALMEEEMVKKAQELGIETEGKDPRELGKEIREAELTAKAKELGIDTANKSDKELFQEVREAEVLQAAEKLGINTEGKDTHEIMKEIHENYAEEAKELGLFKDKPMMPHHEKDFKKFEPRTETE